VEVKIELQTTQKKKLTARERVDYLMDEGSFEEIGVLVTPYD
jgi:propionyl-CoA carboxylase beta chain